MAIETQMINDAACALFFVLIVFIILFLGWHWQCTDQEPKQLK